ncbi:cytochrome c oxidase assembly factor Coa1 family protein [Gilvimarinus chinensis]|uniref:cytochrome c oxidase assembly factor Coa1 family protein n=1 Tax=Gilvimarinus chinensis TaxID=396005 RepID=UPI0003796ED8|nr:cytochrome c oxidase assembly factor Coa1 family protein [Gilvimarinus chinensis]
MTKNGKIALTSLSLLVFFGFLFLLYNGYKLFRGDLYEQSLVALEQHPEIKKNIGVPFEPSLLFSGNYFVNSLFMQYEITGAQGNGWVVMIAQKNEGDWHLDRLWVHTGEEEYITVIEPESYSFDADEYQDKTVDDSSGSCEAPLDYQGYTKEGEEPLPTDSVLLNDDSIATP